MQPEDLIREMNEYYARRAPLHDGYMGYIDNETMEDLLRPIILWVEPYVRGRDVLEVACGTGNWAQVLSRRARSVLATDVSPEVIEIARAKAFPAGNVTLEVADAYDLSRLPGRFDAAFGADWWSHMPRSRIRLFLEGLIGKLMPGSRAIFIDMLPLKNFTYLDSYQDDEGNSIHSRRLPSGEEFKVVRNTPSEAELMEAVRGMARDAEYRVHDGLRRWMFAFSTR